MASSKRSVGREVAVPRYQQLRKTLIGLIRDGDYAPGSRLPTEPEIAEQFGVSRMTANRAILSLVSDGWLYRKKRAGTFVADDIGAAKPLLRPVVAIEHPEEAIQDDYFQGLFWNLNSEIMGHGLSLKMVDLPSSDRVRKLLSYEPTPLIVLGPKKPILDDLLEIARQGTQVVAVGTQWQGFGMIGIDSDNIEGAATAVGHLNSLGHREIAFIGAWPEDSNTTDRLRGYRAAVNSRGLRFLPERVVMGGGLLTTDVEARARVVELLKSKDRPTAVFAAGGQLAMEVIGIAQSLGLRVPDDLSVVGYDDPPSMVRTFPPVTTIRQPLVQMAHAIAKVVVASLPADQNPLIFDPELVIRGTTAVPKTPTRGNP